MCDLIIKKSKHLSDLDEGPLHDKLPMLFYPKKFIEEKSDDLQENRRDSRSDFIVKTDKFSGAINPTNLNSPRQLEGKIIPKLDSINPLRSLLDVKQSQDQQLRPSVLKRESHDPLRHYIKPRFISSDALQNSNEYLQSIESVLQPKIVN